MLGMKRTATRFGATRFAGEEDGSVTIDWIVLTAGLVGLAIAVLASVGGGASDLADRTNASIEEMAANG